MTDKQIIIDYKNLCKNYSKEVGCYNTFDGSCNKEQCFTYRLLQLLQAKEQECEKLKEAIDSLLKIQYQLADSCTKYEQTLTEIKEICNSVENIENINSLYDAKLSGMYLQVNKILQKISKCEVNNDNK